MKKESIKERDRAFWEEAAARQSPFVPSASLQGINSLIVLAQPTNQAIGNFQVF